jgi:hypothetical protein
VIGSGALTSESWACDIGMLVADSLHPVTNPAVDSFGNIFTTFSGSRGQKVPVAVYKIDLNFALKPFINELMNATALTFDEQGTLYISSRYDGFVYQVTPNGNMSVYVEGMGVATGIAFDSEHNLYVGDRSGTIFKISPTRQIFVFATLEPSISAYHLTFGPDGYLTSPAPPPPASMPSSASTMKPGETFYRGLGRPKVWHSTRTAVSTSPPPSPAQGRRTSSIPIPRADLFSLRPRHRRPRLHPVARHGRRHHQCRPPRRFGIKGGPLLMNAEIIAIGSEMLAGDRLDTNSLYLTAELNKLGVEVVTKCVIGDDRDRLAAQVRQSMGRSPILILSGGLGPTEDDVTRDAVAKALDRKLIFDM